MKFCSVIVQASCLFSDVNIFASLGTRQQSRVQLSTPSFCQRLVSYICHEKGYCCSSVATGHVVKQTIVHLTMYFNSFSYFALTITMMDQLLGAVISILHDNSQCNVCVSTLEHFNCNSPPLQISFLFLNSPPLQ